MLCWQPPTLRLIHLRNCCCPGTRLECMYPACAALPESCEPLLPTWLKYRGPAICDSGSSALLKGCSDSTTTLFCSPPRRSASSWRCRQNTKLRQEGSAVGMSALCGLCEDQAGAAHASVLGGCGGSGSVSDWGAKLLQCSKGQRSTTVCMLRLLEVRCSWPTALECISCSQPDACCTLHATHCMSDILMLAQTMAIAQHRAASA